MSKAAADTLKKVSDEFESEVLADLQEGRGQALALVESVRRDALEAIAKILQSGTKQSESLKRQVVGAAELEVRNAQLKVMEEAVNEVFGEAIHSIPKTSPARYEKSIIRLIKEGVDVIGPRASVTCSAGDRKAVASAVRRLSKGQVKLAMDPKSLNVIGGVVLTTTDGSIRFDNTFETRLERMKPVLRKEVAALLTRSA
jgi:V/A-type H+-transporting ATPase subunit E